MLFAISAAQRPWIALVFAACGTACELLNHHDVAVSLITAAITIATLAQKPEPERRNPRARTNPPVPPPPPLPLPPPPDDKE